MPARRRHYPGLGPKKGTAGTAAAYQLCARPGCGDARIRHPADGPCGAVHYVEDPGAVTGPGITAKTCECPGFTETEE